MLHLTRNVGTAQRVLRIIAGGMMAVGGVMLFQGQPAGYVLAAMGAMGLLTGLTGYCPACAMIGARSPERP